MIVIVRASEYDTNDTQVHNADGGMIGSIDTDAFGGDVTDRLRNGETVRLSLTIAKESDEAKRELANPKAKRRTFLECLKASHDAGGSAWDDVEDVAAEIRRIRGARR